MSLTVPDLLIIYIHTKAHEKRWNVTQRPFSSKYPWPDRPGPCPTEVLAYTHKLMRYWLHNLILDIMQPILLYWYIVKVILDTKYILLCTYSNTVYG